MTPLLDRLKKIASNIAFPEPELVSDFRRTYFALRIWLGIIGLSLTIILVWLGLIHGVQWDEMTSVSALYWLDKPTADHPLLRDSLVGSLVAAGIALVIYRGYGPWENRLLNVAGGALVVVALFPMAWPVPRCDDRWTFSLHWAAAIIFFISIGATIAFCAHKTLHIEGIDLRSKVRWVWWRSVWWWIYAIFATLMVAAPLSALWLSGNCQQTFWAEATGVVTFSVYWFVKTYELWKVSKAEPSADKPAPKIKWIDGKLVKID